VEEAEREMRAAIEFHLEGLERAGYAIPVSSCSVEYVEVAA
jgi:predicted RNase H-like HicB family nuclease